MTSLQLLQTECLSDEVLQRYLAGYLPEDSATQVEQHLSQCTQCEELMREIDSHASCDELLRPIQSHSGAAQEQPLVAPGPWLPWLSSREIGPYELIEPLGHGGMGLVYLARHRKLDRLVAIKLLPAHHQTAEARVRFEREILAAGRLQHPAIVSATDAGQFGDLDYLVMEYVRGLDLGRLSKSIPILNFEETCEIGRQIAIGLSYAHAQGFVHRDIKPSNVILDDAGVVKLLDFGLVLFDRWDGVSNELTTVGQFLGTLDYMAPEQAERCGSVDFRADLYALGATLFKLLCGRAPLAAAPNQSPIDKLRLLATHRPPSLKTLRPDAPEALVRLVDCLLSTTPQARPASAAHVAEELQSLAKPGCLVALMARARSTEVDTKTPDPSQIELRRQPSPSSASPIPLQGSFVRDGNSVRWWPWIAAALVPLAFLAGYIIQLDTPDGQFIIESEVAGAQVRIVKAGAETQRFKIDTGNMATKLSAGKYEVTLDSPSDGVSIDRDTFVIERGAVVIARVRRASAISNATTPNTLPTPSTETKANAAEAIYDGKPLSAWLEIARREKELKSWLVAMGALNALLDSEQKKELFEEVFQLCIAKQNFSVAINWGLELPLTERIVKEIENSDSAKRLQLAALTGRSFSESRLDPVWKRLDNMAKQDPVEAERLASKVLGLTGGGANSPESKIKLVVYMIQHFPQLASLYDAYLVDHWEELSARPGMIVTQVSLLLGHIQGLAIKRLESLDKGYADRIAALAFILSANSQEFDGYSNLSQPQKELVGKRTVELIANAWENRATPYVAVWRGYAIFSHFQWSEQTQEQPNLCVPRLMFVIQQALTRGQLDAPTRSRILSALAILEERSRNACTEAVVELQKVLIDVSLSETKFSLNNFRMEQKFSKRLPSSQEVVVYPLPSTLSPDRRAKIDEWSFAYNVHRWVSDMIFGEKIEKLSPTQIGASLSAFRSLDLDRDWLLSAKEWLPPKHPKIGLTSGPFDIRSFSRMIASWDLLREKSDPEFTKIDKDNDNRLSDYEAKEAVSVKEFQTLDRDLDGYLDAGEYSLRADPTVRALYLTKMKRDDKDGNGFLTSDEVSDASIFAKSDVNKDGKVDLDEYIASRHAK